MLLGQLFLTNDHRYRTRPWLHQQLHYLATAGESRLILSMRPNLKTVFTNCGTLSFWKRTSHGCNISSFQSLITQVLSFEGDCRNLSLQTQHVWGIIQNIQVGWVLGMLPDNPLAGLSRILFLFQMVV